MHNPDPRTSTGTSAGKPGWFKPSPSSSANTSPEQGHEYEKPTIQPLLIPRRRLEVLPLQALIVVLSFLLVPMSGWKLIGLKSRLTPMLFPPKSQLQSCRTRHPNRKVSKVSSASPGPVLVLSLHSHYN
ncbi:hypothetical protein B0H19DRAFT_1248512 [Mycena capillaripes]|nr:hypothetical protein B0H19DRAFT_1248512 [Mycena capillaripes]